MISEPTRLSRRVDLGREWQIDKILSKFAANYLVKGENSSVTGAASLSQAGENDLAFCSWDDEKAISMITDSKAGIILCHASLRDRVQAKQKTQLVFLDNPRLVFVKFLNDVRRETVRPKEWIAPSAVIHETARVGSGCHIGNFVTIGKNCTVGDNTVIGDGARLVKECKIGDNSDIQSGVIVGSDGFAFERGADGKLERFPHVGGVIIESNVEICANSSIAGGSLSDTIIGKGTKLDALVHVAHNVTIGRDCQLAAGTIIGGSTRIGDSCWTGLNSTIKNQLTIGNSVLVAAGACVTNNVQDGDIVAGVPAKSIKDKVRTRELFIMTGKKDLQ